MVFYYQQQSHKKRSDIQMRVLDVDLLQQGIRRNVFFNQPLYI